MDIPAIGFYGGMALLISSITGPGLTTIPLLFQQAGWFTPVVAFLLFAVISYIASLLLVETMSTIRGNEKFQANVEYSTVAHLYLGNKAHAVMQVLLFCALQSVNVSSIIISEQTMDSLLIRLFHKTCALSFTQGWTCATEVDSGGSPFDSYILFSFGYLISACMVIPLSMMSLVQNIKFQLASVAALFFVMICWIFIFAKQGLDQSVPPINTDQSNLVGFVLNNFAFITTVPSFINELSRNVSIHKVIGFPIVLCVILYIIIGLMGASSFKVSSSSDILATLSASDQNAVLIDILNIVFPISVLVTSVPVFAIVIRYNLVRGALCSNKWAIVWASVVPWILIIPFQTKGWLITIMNWSSLIFGSSTNFIIPLVLFIASKTYSASTADATGGDIFVLRRQSNASRISRRSSQHSRSHSTNTGTEAFPSFITPEGGRSSIHLPSPFVTVRSPSVSRRVSFADDGDSLKETSKHYEEVDITEMGQASSSSHLDPNSQPLRVVFSPTVTRNPSVSEREHPQIVIHGSESSEHVDQQVVDRGESSTSTRGRSMSFKAPNVQEQTLHKRSRSRPETTTTTPNLSLDTNFATSAAHPRTSFIRTPISPFPQYSARSAFEEVETPEFLHLELDPAVFRAFRNRRFWKSVLVAKIVLGITVCCVLGNLIYTIVSTAQGNNSLNS